jgi:hypothetical protein
MDTLPSFGRLALLGFVLILAPGSSSFAQTHKGKHGGHHQPATVSKPAQPAPASKSPAAHPQQAATAQAGAHPQPTLTDAELMDSLHRSRAHLAQAGRDDRGRQTRALQEVNSAINLLSTPSRSTKTDPRSQQPGIVETSGPRPEFTSETHVSEAQRLLEAIEARMSGDGVNAHGYVQARASIQNAIRELNLALVDR